MKRKAEIYRKKLLKLEKLRQELSRKLDKAYLRSNIKDFTDLEMRYQNVVNRIEKLQTKLQYLNMSSYSKGQDLGLSY